MSLNTFFVYSLYLFIYKIVIEIRLYYGTVYCIQHQKGDKLQLVVILSKNNLFSLGEM